jgi:hypothetical protein
MDQAASPAQETAPGDLRSEREDRSRPRQHEAGKEGKPRQRNKRRRLEREQAKRAEVARRAHLQTPQHEEEPRAGRRRKAPQQPSLSPIDLLQWTTAQHRLPDSTNYHFCGPKPRIPRSHDARRILRRTRCDGAQHHWAWITDHRHEAGLRSRPSQSPLIPRS